VDCSDSVLVVVMGEMGRSPKVNAKAGRDHWPQCGFCLLTGGGVKKGMVYGSTDSDCGLSEGPSGIARRRGWRRSTNCSAIDPRMTVPDQTGRPIPIAHGAEPIRDVIA